MEANEIKIIDMENGRIDVNGKYIGGFDKAGNIKKEGLITGLKTIMKEKTMKELSKEMGIDYIGE